MNSGHGFMGSFNAYTVIRVLLLEIIKNWSNGYSVTLDNHLRCILIGRPKLYIYINDTVMSRSAEVMLVGSLSNKDGDA